MTSSTPGSPRSAADYRRGFRIALSAWAALAVLAAAVLLYTIGLAHHPHRIELGLVVAAAVLVLTGIAMTVWYRATMKAVNSPLVVACVPGYLIG